MQNLKGLGDPNSPPPKNEQLGDILGYSGLGLMAASLPFLISASSNKKKALGMSIEQDAAMTLYKNGLAKTAFPSISIKIAF
jgi:hypothetical protein